MKALIVAILLVVSLAYPLLVFWGINHLSPAIFACVLFTLVVARIISTASERDYRLISLLSVMATYSALVGVSNSEFALRFYPAVMSLGIAGLFLISLVDPQNIIEKMAAAAGKVITDNAKRYTRKLTMIWGIVLVFNSVVASYLAVYGSLKVWALYCGLISYFVFAAFFAAEWCFRQYYIKRYGA